MTRMIRISTLCLALLTLGVLGCGGPGEKDKNKDKDVPKPAGKPG